MKFRLRHPKRLCRTVHTAQEALPLLSIGNNLAKSMEINNIFSEEKPQEKSEKRTKHSHGFFQVAYHIRQLDMTGHDRTCQNPDKITIFGDQLISSGKTAEMLCSFTHFSSCFSRSITLLISTHFSRLFPQEKRSYASCVESDKNQLIHLSRSINLP